MEVHNRMIEPHKHPTNPRIEEEPLLSPSSIFSPRLQDGRLFINVVSCTVTWPSKCKHGYYCTLMVEKQNSRTATIEAHQDGSPTNGIIEWDQRFNFDITQENAEVKLSVWGKKENSKYKALGSLQINVSDLPPNQSKHMDYTISHKYNLKLTFYLSPIVKRKLAEEDFERIRIIGKGSFGTVLLVKKKETGCLYAMKVLHKKSIIERNAVHHAKSERAVLKTIHHPFLAHLKYAFQNPEHLFIVIDYLNGGELFFHLQHDDSFSEERTKFYAAEIVLALGYLHDNGIIYRDLKPENILLDIEGHICVVDFGLCKTGLGLDTKTKTFCGSLEYMAPELLQGKEYGKDIDWWALATMVYEMIEGLPPFWDEDSEVMIEKISLGNIAELLENNEKFSDECKDFILSILQMEPSKRLGYGENGTQNIKDHKWFADIDWAKLYNKQIEPYFKPHLDHESDTRYFDEEVTSEDPHLPNFTSKLEEEQDNHFDDFSFEEPIYITPSSNKRPRSNNVTKFTYSNLLSFKEKKSINPRSYEIQPVIIESLHLDPNIPQVPLHNSIAVPVQQDSSITDNINH